MMKTIDKKSKLIKRVFCSILLSLILFITPLSIESVEKNTKCNTFAACGLEVSIEKENLPYSFKISDKLIGEGQINLSIDGNKIKGSAKGIGMTCQCDVDLTTEIDGLFNNTEYINVKVSGIGDPKGFIPGKIGFSGPLKGELLKDKISLVGNVNIEGKIARYAGFKEIEEVTIEIPASGLIQSYREKAKQQALALR